MAGHDGLNLSSLLKRGSRIKRAALPVKVKKDPLAWACQGVAFCSNDGHVRNAPALSSMRW